MSSNKLLVFISPDLSGAYVCVEVDGFEFYDRRKQTSLSAFCVTPQWDEVSGGKPLWIFRNLDNTICDLC